MLQAKASFKHLQQTDFMKKISVLTCLFTILGFSLVLAQSSKQVYSSKTLKILQLTDNAFLHITYLLPDSPNPIACNGLIYFDEGEAVIFDTPTSNNVSKELINWIEEGIDCKVKAVVVNHFHIDCMGGLRTFTEKGIPSYANKKTVKLALKNGATIFPTNAFNKKQVLKIGKKSVINRQFGQAHSKDNIVSYFPDDELLFGGCEVKSLKAGKGNLADANVKAWPKTIQKIKKAYPQLQIVVPGHGPSGDMTLLDYTIEMFSFKK